MMLDIFLIRHGESEYNMQPIVQGRSDHVPLSEEGKRQALKLAERRKRAGWEYDVVFCSISERAKQTVEIAFAEYSPIFSEEIVEISRGDWEGKPYSETGWHTVPVSESDEEYILTFKAPGGESLSDVCKRVKSWYESHVQKYEKDTKRIAIVTHGHLIRSFLMEVIGLSARNAYRIMLANTSVTHVRFEEGRGWRICRINDAAHVYG